VCLHVSRFNGFCYLDFVCFQSTVNVKSCRRQRAHNHVKFVLRLHLLHLNLSVCYGEVVMRNEKQCFIYFNCMIVWLFVFLMLVIIFSRLLSIDQFINY